MVYCFFRTYIIEMASAANSCVGKRHIVAIMSFTMCTLLYIHRLVMGVAIVAMVKQKQTSGNTAFNASKLSCPLALYSNYSTDNFSGGDLDWSTEQQGYVLGVSFFGYFITQLPGGRWAETWGAKRTVFAGNILSAVCTFLTPMATWWNLYAVIAIQFMRGLGQGVVTPALFVLMANWFPRNERGFLSTFVVSGLAIGGTIGGVVTGWLSDEPQLGWEAAFYLFGVYTAVVSAIFFLVVCETPQKHTSIMPWELKIITEGQESDLTLERPPTPWRKILTSGSVFGLCFGLFGQFWSVTYFLSVHPTYMGTILHFSMTENGAASSIPISLKSVGGLIACFFTNWITKNNYMSLSNLRKTCNSVGTLGFSVCLLAAYWAKCDHLTNIICFTLSLFCSGVSLSGALIASGDMSPRFSEASIFGRVLRVHWMKIAKKYRHHLHLQPTSIMVFSSLMGLGSTFASTSTFIIPVMVGFITKNQTMDEWHTVFFISVAIVLASGFIFIFFGSAEVQPWNDPEPQEHSKTKTEISECVMQCSVTKF